ncbi:hypothetical protein KOW79_020953 [Hemibagrus wyckioides]|uniref:Uncharacterized protein n=1 Tax=Hemibagrus wyckioides TaxID=337641 RepID=A0A9D3S9V3_9TELE|nr:hypothetical protein KOW79_020953 [Hemibagrus wyckioides]
MVNPSCGNEPHVDKFKEHQSQCEAVQYKESDKEISMSADEREAVSGSVVVQGNACDGLEPADVQEIDTDLIVVLPEEIQCSVTTTETEELCTDIKNEPQDQKDLEGAIIKFLGDLDETKATSSPQSSPNPSPSLHVNRDDLPFQEIEENSMDPKARDDHAERLSDTILEHTEETCFSSEIQSQATEETEPLEPPAKKRLKRRMGMCGLGDRKKKLLFDGRHCRQGLLGRQREERALKGNEVVQHLYNTVLESDGTTPMDHERTTGPACKENDEEVLKASEKHGAAVMDDDRTTGEAEKEDRYNTSKCTVLMNDEANADESPKEYTDVLKKGTSEENHGTVNMDDKGTAEQVVFMLDPLEDTSTGMGQALPSLTTGTNLNMIQDELSGPAAPSDHQMEPATCGEEPNFPGTEMTNSGQDMEFNMKHEVQCERQTHHTDNKVHEDPDEIAAEVEVAHEVSGGTTCAEIEVSEDSVMVTKVVQAVQTGLEECEIEIEEKHPPNFAATEKHEPNSPDLSRSTEKGLDHMGILEVTSTYETQNEKGQGENDQSATAVYEGMDRSGGDAEDFKEISEPLAPPTGQELHMHNARDTTVTPTVGEQQVCNPTLTSVASELPQEADLSDQPLLYSMTDSQIHKIALSMELEDQPDPEDCDQQEDASELVCGLIRELSSLNRTVMAAHREMELLRRGKPPKAPNRRHCGLPHPEK